MTEGNILIIQYTENKPVGARHYSLSGTLRITKNMIVVGNMVKFVSLKKAVKPRTDNGELIVGGFSTYGSPESF